MNNQVDSSQLGFFGATAFVFFGAIAIFAPKIIGFFHGVMPIVSEETLVVVAKIYRVAAIFFAGMGLAMAVSGLVK